ncbi:ChuX/HutX family heme-like substrate-binding protein [Azospirillum sp.]|uniref:ChuX/HutX family heme-like substrate-binding protein n=1 Tax=Azospirillum sp. TaxID=34012 RepID=UPI002D70CFE6|nr:ChuX/HutX family heme-like substrate-binding protein [Azospirillum sp.]HYF87692.1 ChuX/HutX family heme-like substrate-binding protein [Azospirillum sp.]
MPDTSLPSIEAPTVTDTATGHLRLEVDWPAVLPRLDVLGPVRVVTANRAITHEKVGRFGNVSGNGHAIIVLNREIDLRIFPRHWCRTAYDPAVGAILIRNAAGQPVHAIHRTADTDAAAWDAFLDEHRADGDLADEVESGEPPVQTVATVPADIDVAGLRAAWTAMADVHEFHGMLKRFGVARLDAMRLAGGEFAREIPLTAVTGLLESARGDRMEIMIFVGNAGCIQIHTGTIATLRTDGALLGIDDPGFRLHVDTARLSSAWAVFKPTDKGGITTVELYNAQGENCAILCGQRDEDKPERTEWRTLARSMPDLPGVG